MAYRVKFLSLQKAELEYEVSIRGSTPAGTVVKLREQIAKLGPLFPSEDILESSLPVSDDLKGISDALTKLRALIESSSDKNALLRAQNLICHLYHRLNRISGDSTVKQAYDSCVSEFRSLSDRYEIVKDSGADTLASASSEQSSVPQSSVPLPQLNVNVSCERSMAGEVTKFKFDGKSCVRSFIQRISDFAKARNISGAKLLSYSTEIFSGVALHWFRAVEEQISSWDDLISRLRADFSQEDYDYRLTDEIRARTQGETENITVYLSIMAGLFARLSKSLPEADKLEILLHNIRPCYASTLSSSPNITDIDTLRTLCRNYESIQTRTLGFHEPPRVSTGTLAPEFAYAGQSTSKFNNSNNNNFFNRNKRSFNNFNNSGCKGNNNNYVHAMQRSEQRNVFCPRCRSNTHSLRQCRAKKDRIFCFKCGEVGVKTPDCPKCGINNSVTPKN